MRFLPLLLTILAACGGTPAETPDTNTTPPAIGGASNPLDGMPIAQYLGEDNATGQRVFDLLKASGIQSSAGGSLGYSVWVSATDRDKAREILLAAASNECLRVTIFDDAGAMLDDARPARCNPPAQTAPAKNVK